jgi:hypothetical protein
VGAPSEKAADYYPLSLGWKWAYDLQEEGKSTLAIYTVLERTNDAAVILAGQEKLGYMVTPDGIARRDGTQPTDFILKNPVKMGTNWTVADGKAEIVAVGREVTVPAGTFPNCVTVEEMRAAPQRVIRTTFASGIGPVMLELQMQDPTTGKFQVAIKASLRGVTKPGEDPLGPEKKNEPVPPPPKP